MAALVGCAVVAFDTGAEERADLTPLLDAARSFDHATAIRLVLEGADVNAAENDGTTALHWAAYADDAALVVALLDAGADPNAENRYGLTPLQTAAEAGHVAAVTALLDAGADAGAALPEGETVLMTAARSGHTAVLEALLDSGVDIEARDSFYGETALIWAAVEDHAGAVDTLIAHGANVDAPSTEIDYPTRRAGQSVLGLGHWTPIMYAARENALEAGRALIAAGADLDLKDPDGATALVIAIINAHYEFAELLIEAGADPDIGDNEAGMGPLYAAVDMHRLAVGHGRGTPPPVGLLTAVDTARSLLEAGAHPNAQLKKPILTRTHTMGDSALGAGATPLLRAAKSGDIEMVRLLVEHGADPHARMPNGTTALHFVAGLGWRNGSPIAPSYDQGAEPEAIETIDYLLELGLDISAQNEAGDTPLHSAVSGRQSEMIVAHLLERGADPSIENGRGQTALALAQARSSAQIAGLVGAASE
ncbi:MAG: ankyrin repeat domain-containing protein [Gammaproteobacteria bacterium]|jgi:ankyrin repeat protein